MKKNKADVVDKSNETKKVATTTHYLLVVDSSSSMSSLTEQTISGVNEQIETIRELSKDNTKQKYTCTFIQFNSQVTVEFTGKKGIDTEPISKENYRCGGMTALNDAIGVGLTKIQEKYGKDIKAGDAEAIVTILTDGEENSSREFDGAKIKSMVDELNATDGWTITFVGANIDAIAAASRYGISKDNAMNYSADIKGTKDVFRTMSKSMKTRGAAMASGQSFGKLGYFADGLVDSDTDNGDADLNASNIEGNTDSDTTDSDSTDA